MPLTVRAQGTGDGSLWRRSRAAGPARRPECRSSLRTEEASRARRAALSPASEVSTRTNDVCGPIFPRETPSGASTYPPAFEGTSATDCLQRISRPGAFARSEARQALREVARPRREGGGRGLGFVSLQVWVAPPLQT